MSVVGGARYCDVYEKRGKGDAEENRSSPKVRSNKMSQGSGHEMREKVAADINAKTINQRLDGCAVLRAALWLSVCAELGDGGTSRRSGKGATDSTFCVSICPDPTITCTPIEGIPLTTTNTKVGPGANKEGFGGI